jgi:UDP-N-acetylglucosamine--N-acetylmuramyl-(pentapeptide) pyrophosphoryl-undecaprenol N-acetylglucosamine transferase
MKLVLAGGGTGGHLFPALAIAEALKSEDPSSEVLFVGTKRGIEARLIPQTIFPIKFVSARGMMRTGIFNFFRAGLEIPIGIIQSFKIISDFKPDFVLGVGGYASAPTLAAALILNIKTGVQEQNSIMGAANRMLAKFVDKIFISWENTKPSTPSERTFLVGNPVRQTLLEDPESIPGNSDKFKILIFGGSRGANSLNLGIIEHLSQLKPKKDQIRIVHQTGSELFEKVREAYQEAGIEAEVKDFITNMGSYYSWADLVICRAGASSLAEITAVGKPAIVVPFPFAAEDHQAKNAEWLESRNAVKTVRDADLKEGALITKIIELMESPSSLESMAKNARILGKPNAARSIVIEILKDKRLAA